MKYKRERLKHTVAVHDATKIQAGPVRLVLMRIFSPLGDPYSVEEYANPHVSMTPYYEGKVAYSATLFIGQKFRLQLELGDR
jgi:hypothetical protein